MQQMKKVFPQLLAKLESVYSIDVLKIFCHTERVFRS